MTHEALGFVFRSAIIALPTGDFLIRGTTILALAQALARVVFRQRLTPRQMLGMAVIVLGVALLLRNQP